MTVIRFAATAVVFSSLLISAAVRAQAPAAASGDSPPIELGSRRELFVDDFLIDRTQNVRYELARPRDEGVALKFDRPWEGAFCGYCTVMAVDGKFRVYYRGLPTAQSDGSARESTCVAFSDDGIHWSKPELGLFSVDDTTKNNVVLSQAAPFTHNFSPFLDERPGVPATERFKAVAGVMSSGLALYASPDGLKWQRMHDKPFLTKDQVPFRYMFDSQNLAFWSALEGKYVCFFRVFEDNIRRVARTDSTDLVHWSPPVLMQYRHRGGSAPIEHLYTSQTHPYFHAPHIYVSLAARFFPGRQVLSESQAKEVGVNPGYFKDTSDAILQTTRGGNVYERTSLEGFIRPGVGPQNWVSRTNYPALNILKTGPTEMSIYVNQDYAQPTAHLHRYSVRLDGLASLRAGYSGGEVVTKPLTFAGRRLLLNFATSAAGGVRVEVQDAKGKPLPGFSLD
ncbi:MAG: hypothetical protein AB7O38_31140, partial [Pirellulaceae bacterium]